jgi:hypothetical protein
MTDSLSDVIQQSRGADRPRMGSIKLAMLYSGKCRSVLYDDAAKNPGLFKKDGHATRVDFDVLDKILDDLPTAKIKPIARSATKLKRSA